MSPPKRWPGTSPDRRGVPVLIDLRVQYCNLGLVAALLLYSSSSCVSIWRQVWWRCSACGLVCAQRLTSTQHSRCWRKAETGVCLDFRSLCTKTWGRVVTCECTAVRLSRLSLSVRCVLVLCLSVCPQCVSLSVCLLSVPSILREVLLCSFKKY